MYSLPALLVFAVIPTIVLCAVGILILVFGRGGWDIASGVLIIIFTVIMFIGGLIALTIFRKNIRTRRLQTDFLAKVSHELRTPLASIRLFVDTLGEGTVDPEEQRMVVGALSAETSRLTTLIERLLTWGRMESGRRIYDRRPERVDTLVAEALAQVTPQVMETGIQVRLELPDDVPAILGDRAALVEILLNLLRNAIQYGGSGGEIRVCVRREKRRVLIDVADRGPGIRREEQRRIFERFYRGSAARLAQRTGSGLGLSMALHIARAHRGKIRLRSREGEGACFTLDLPAIPAEAALTVAPG